MHYTNEVVSDSASEHFRVNHKLRELLLMLCDRSLQVSEDDIYSELAAALRRRFPDARFWARTPSITAVISEATYLDLLGFDVSSHSFHLSDNAKRLLQRSDVIRCDCGASMARYWRGGGFTICLLSLLRKCFVGLYVIYVPILLKCGFFIKIKRILSTLS